MLCSLGMLCLCILVCGCVERSYNGTKLLAVSVWQLQIVLFTRDEVRQTTGKYSSRKGNHEKHENLDH